MTSSPVPHPHSHSHPGHAHARKAFVPGFSVLRASAGKRLLVAAVLCAVMWTAVYWVLQ